MRGGLRLYISVNLYNGSYQRFQKHMEQEHQGIHYMSFVSQAARNDVGVIVRLPTASNLARILTIIPLNPRQGQIQSLVHGHEYGVVPFKDHSVWDYLVEGLGMHDQQFPNHREAFVKFVFQGQPIAWQQWTRNVKEFLGMAHSKKPKAKASPEKPKKGGESEKKGKGSARKVLKKPSKS